ncbi:MAG: helix-turn-helix transcriptional regulator [Ruminococcaceae bacterium]|nr:helix-turn-helix transcriptional regulator [Oscillospiraceae bacterium]
MMEMKLDFFTHFDSFPFFIQFGGHQGGMYFHTHIDFSELVIVLDGQAINVVGEEQFPVEKGDVFVMGKGSSHGYLEARDFKICNIMFDFDSLLNANYDVKELEGFHALFLLDPLAPDGFKSRLKLSPEKFREIKKTVLAALEEYEGGSPARQSMLFAYFMQIVVTLSRLYGMSPMQKETAGVAAAAAYIERHFNENITLERLLEISHYSQRHFIRLFSECYNISPHKYLQNIRMKHACLLLEQTNKPITEIAASCGFNDSNFFTRTFKKQMIMTPTEYRKNKI